jgi:3'-phosphoadenosine 5'-phosphosulfate sulfotransferase (PAPS reductase)/FAD synthetase
MKDYFKIEGPAIISFSGGRTSGYMLWRILMSNGGILPKDVHCIFANTGKEMQETLDFVNDCSINWNVPITWIEYKETPIAKERWHTVSYETASRFGEPFEAIIKIKNYLPNSLARFCTSELKVIPIKRYSQQVLNFKEWDMIIGFRADEPRRVAKLSNPSKEPFDRLAPLASAGINTAEILEFWKNSSFDLNLPSVDGKTVGGNCDMCFLKGAAKIKGLIKDNPSSVTWWIAQENRIVSDKYPDGFAKFRMDRKSYKSLSDDALISEEIPYSDDELTECNCTD